MEPKIIIRALVFLGFLLLGFIYLETVFDSDHEFITTRKQLSATQKKTNIDVLLMGSSHMYANINPYLLDKQNKTISFNLGSATMNFDFTSLVLEEVLEKSQPKLVVVELSQSSFPKMEESDKAFHLRLLDYCDNLSIHKFKKFKEHYNPSEFLTVYWQLYRNRKDWARISYFDLAGDIRGNSFKRFRYKGYVGVRDSIGAKLKKEYAQYDVTNIKFDSTQKIIEPRHFEEFDKLKSLANNHGFEVLFITVPDLSTWPYNQYLLDQIKEITASYGFKYLNLCAPAIGNQFALGDYIDRYHLNIWGGVKATAILSDFIGSNYSLPDRSNTLYWQEQMTALKDFESEFISGSDPKVIEIGDSLYEGVTINELSFKKYYEKLLFTANLDTLDQEVLSNQYSLAIQVFTEEGSQHLLSKQSRANNRFYDTNSAVIKDVNKPLSIEIITAIKKIEKIRLFLTNNDSAAEPLGKVITIDGNQLMQE